MADDVVNVDHVTLLKNKVLEIMNEVVEFEDNSELTVASEPPGEPVAKNALVSPRVMPPAQLRPLLYPFAKNKNGRLVCCALK